MAKKEMGIVEKAQSVIMTPEKFFNGIKSEKGIKPAFIFDVVLSAACAAASFIISVAIGGLLAPNASLGVVGAVSSWIFNVLAMFVLVGFFHIFMRLLGGKGKYLDTYKAFVYAGTISLLAVVPMALFGLGLLGIVIGILVMIPICIWGIYMHLKGLAVLHKISMLRAFGALVIAGIVGSIIAIVIFFIFMWPAILAAIAARAA